MSLIIANSTQSGYNRSEGGTNTRTKLGIEQPSQFQNHFTSPIKIPANAEIAVESVKIRRDALIDVEAETMMYHYFGRLQSDDDFPDYQGQRVEMPVPIKPRPGTYNVDEWLKELESRLDEAYGNPEIFGFYGVTANTNGSGEPITISIDSIQRGSLTLANRVAQVSEMLSSYWVAPYQLSDGYVHNTDWTSAHSTFGGIPHKVFTRIAANNASDDTILKKLDRRECSVIGHGSPMGLCGGKFVVDLTNANTGGWRVGLSRPQIEYVRDTTKPAGRGRANLLPGTRHPDGGFDGQTPMSTHYRMTNQQTGRYQKDYYDYMVESDGENISVYQLSYDNEVQGNMLIQSEVEYWGAGMSFATKLTNASFNASFAAVEFRTAGDQVTLHFNASADGTGDNTNVLISTLSTNRKKSFLPIGATRESLYPRINLGTQNNLVRIYQWTSHYHPDSYRYPTYDVENFTFTTGDDFYSNNRVDRFSGGKAGGDDNKAIVRDTKDRPYCLSQTLICDTKPLYEVNELASETRDNVYDGLHISGTSINKKHLFVIGYTESNTKDDYLEGKYRTIDTSGRAKMNRLIGFPNKSIIDETEGVAEGYVDIQASGAQVTFTSFTPPDFRVNSAFVRISNMPIQSYNGGKQSVSKILYHLPRFTNDGREFGDLFFSPGEKTYVSLHNSNSEILNNIEVQIVDSNERPVNDISGNTIVVFHMRERK
jgi:hypothetical protein